VSDIEDESLLDVDTTEVPSNNAEAPNTFGRNLIRRLGIPHDHTEAEATSTSPSSDNTNGGWLLHMVKWEQGHTWQEIADSYLSYIQYLGKHTQKITVVFDGYNNSPKDHDHIKRTKNSCCDVQIQPIMMHSIPRAKFLDNTHIKNGIIHLLSSAFQKHQISVELCDNDADTWIVKAALAAAKDDSVNFMNDCYVDFISLFFRYGQKMLMC